MDEFCSEHSAHQRAIRVHDERMEKHGRELDDLRECVVRLTALQESQAKEYAEWRREAEARIVAIESAPAKRWETITAAALTAMVGAVVGFIAANIGLGA